MLERNNTRINSIAQLYDVLPSDQRIIVDILRQIIIENLPKGFKEKISFNVPYFHGKRGICIVWPAFIPRGGIKEGVLLGFWYGNRLEDKNGYLQRGTNKQIYYKIFKSPEEIDEIAISSLLKEAVSLDSKRFKK